VHLQAYFISAAIAQLGNPGYAECDLGWPGTMPLVCLCALSPQDRIVWFALCHPAQTGAIERNHAIDRDDIVAVRLTAQ